MEGRRQARVNSVEGWMVATHHLTWDSPDSARAMSGPPLGMHARHASSRVPKHPSAIEKTLSVSLFYKFTIYWF